MEQPCKIKAEAALDGAALRAEARDSIFVMATIGRPGEDKVAAKVRDVSAGGLMADCAASYSKGEHLEVDLRGVGMVAGVVAWVEPGGRIGMAFDRRIDATMVRKPVVAPPAAQPSLIKTATRMHRPGLGGGVSGLPPRRFR
ncbi:PilZ domain-containing protein [Sphingomonas naphthae]|uniref:PilZ domain-containing protein n=1 Tax=Sphingomonas naphthae TaxID=1813468 RepID=A0ABY7TN25_9SPHN|nr:PilZ domain-containing protein [Sphingomonas naphthae]WCT74376.1 PilZ domain-containing protein [Sphingomonas naphthae]